MVPLIVSFLAVPPYVNRRQYSVAVTSPPPADYATGRVHRRLIIADLHNDLLLWSRDPNKRAARGHSSGMHPR